MKEGDVVRVVKQRPITGGVFIDILGEVGWIEEVKDVDGMPWAQIQTLRLDGLPGGCGGIPIDCLAPELAPEWIEAKAKHDARIERYLKESAERATRTRERIARVATKYGVTSHVVDGILRDAADEDDR